MSGVIAPLQSVTSFSSDEVYIHRGLAYVVFVKATVAQNGTLDVLLNVPAGLHVHASPLFHSDAAADITIIEGVTYGSGGSDFTPVNKNLNAGLTSTVTAKVGALSVTGGTTIWQEHLGTSKNSGGSVETAFEWDIKQNAATLFRVTSGANGNAVTIAVPWNQPG